MCKNHLCLISATNRHFKHNVCHRLVYNNTISEIFVCHLDKHQNKHLSVVDSLDIHNVPAFCTNIQLLPTERHLKHMHEFLLEHTIKKLRVIFFANQLKVKHNRSCEYGCSHKDARASSFVTFTDYISDALDMKLNPRHKQPTKLQQSKFRTTTKLLNSLEEFAIDGPDGAPPNSFILLEKMPKLSGLFLYQYERQAQESFMNICQKRQLQPEILSNLSCLIIHSNYLQSIKKTLLSFRQFNQLKALKLTTEVHNRISDDNIDITVQDIIDDIIMLPHLQYLTLTLCLQRKMHGVKRSKKTVRPSLLQSNLIQASFRNCSFNFIDYKLMFAHLTRLNSLELYDNLIGEWTINDYCGLLKYVPEIQCLNLAMEDNFESLNNYSQTSILALNKLHTLGLVLHDSSDLFQFVPILTKVSHVSIDLSKCETEHAFISVMSHLSLMQNLKTAHVFNDVYNSKPVLPKYVNDWMKQIEWSSFNINETMHSLGFQLGIPYYTTARDSAIVPHPCSRTLRL